MDATAIRSGQGNTSSINVPNLTVLIHSGWSGYRSLFVYVQVTLCHTQHQSNEQYRQNNPPVIIKDDEASLYQC